jgi:hypothetical protein
MVTAISRPDEDGAIDFKCNTQDAVSSWPISCGQRSTMIIIDETTTPHTVNGFGIFVGSAWATF